LEHQLEREGYPKRAKKGSDGNGGKKNERFVLEKRGGGGGPPALGEKAKNNLVGSGGRGDRGQSRNRGEKKFPGGLDRKERPSNQRKK